MERILRIESNDIDVVGDWDENEVRELMKDLDMIEACWVEYVLDHALEDYDICSADIADVLETGDGNTELKLRFGKTWIRITFIRK